MAGYNWSWAKTEPELRNLYEWLDTERIFTRRRGKISVVIAIFAIYLVAFFVMLFGESSAGYNFLYYIWSLIAAASVSVGLAVWHVRSASLEHREHLRRLGVSQTFVWQLYMARWQGLIKETLGSEAARVLNDGAKDFLRCRAAFKSAAWRSVASDSPWASARDKAESAMEAGMARLITGMTSGTNANDPEIVNLLADMRDTADEVVETADKLAKRHGLVIGASNELRQVLGEMRSLNQADDELGILDQRQG